MLVQKYLFSSIFLVAIGLCRASFFKFNFHEKPTTLVEDSVDEVQAINSSLISEPQTDLIAQENPSRDPFIELIVSRLKDSQLGNFLILFLNDTSKVVDNVNTFLGKDVLIWENNHIRVNFASLMDLAKEIAGKVLRNTLSLNGLVLRIVEQIVDNNLDRYGAKFKSEVDKIQLSPNDHVNRLRAGVTPTSGQDVLRSFIRNLLIDFLRPLQPVLNQTFLNITNEILRFYNPVLPTGYIGSILTFAVNQTITRVVQIIDSLRTFINSLLTLSNQRQLDITETSTEEQKDKKPKSFIDVILAPVRFLLGLIMTPLHQFLRFIFNYIFVTLRPVVGKIILSPVENIVMYLINIIPCMNCS